jgi:O-acetyl-ADP-ribose deacetylase (regulator of RNase III)
MGLLMIKYIKGDVTEPQFDTKYCMIIHGVNDTGVSFGSGVAGAITRKWPQAREDYLSRGNKLEILGEQLNLGDTFYSSVGKNIYIFHLVSQNGLISQDNPKPAKKWAILKGLESILYKDYDFNDITIISPKIGCGLGGLSWDNDVEPLYNLMFKERDIFIYDIN